MKHSSSKPEMAVSPDMILASGSMVVRSKMTAKGAASDLLGTQSLRKIGSEIAILQHTGEQINKKFQKKKKNIEKLQKEIVQKEKEIKEISKPPKDDLAPSMPSGSEEDMEIWNRYKDKSNKFLMREIKNLENKLENLVPKCNSAVSENRNIREKIDALRKEKNFSWCRIYAKLEKELKEKKAEMKRAIDKAERVCKEREAIKEEIDKIKLQDEKEEAEYQRQVTLLKQYIEKDRQVKDYLQTKQELEKAENDEKQSKETVETTNLNERVNTEKAIRKKALEKANEIASSIQNIIVNSEENPDGLPSTKDLKNLRDEKKAANADKGSSKNASGGNRVLEEFQEAETQNFRLGYFVDEVKDEIDAIDKEIEEIKDQINEAINSNKSEEKIAIDQTASQTEGNQDLLTTQINSTTIPNMSIYDPAYQDELKKAQEEEVKYKRKIEDADKTINALKLGIQSIYNRMGVDQDELKEILGSYGVITESNMMQYLGVIEEKTNELIETYQVSKNGAPVNQNKNQTNKKNNSKTVQVNKALLPDSNTIENDLKIAEKDTIMTIDHFMDKGMEIASQKLS